MDFTALHGYRDFARIYEVALRLANLREHFAFPERKLDVLDIQGGNGILGRLIQRDLEGRINYTNIDNEGESLKQYPKFTLKADSHFLSSKVEPSGFDYVFCLNHDSHVWLPYFADTENVFSDNYVDVTSIKGLITAIHLIQIGVFLRNGGIFVESGPLTEDNINAFSNFLNEMGTGIQLKEIKDLVISHQAATAFAEYDVRRSIGYDFNPETRSYEKPPEQKIKRIADVGSKDYRIQKLAVFSKTSEGDATKIMDELIKSEKILAGFEEQIAQKDMFGPW